MLDTVFFYFFALMVLGGAILTVTLRSAVHCAISLIVSLAGVAGLYLLQQAEFLFATQIILYVGGIMVLFLFVIMLVNLDEAAKEHRFRSFWWVGTAAAVLAGAQILYFVNKGAEAFRLGPAAPPSPPTQGNVEQIADALFSQYLLPFELASVLLLAAVVGSVVMAKKRI
jgi:NADH-quinone oxidoreductase subunit J